MSTCIDKLCQAAKSEAIDRLSAEPISPAGSNNIELEKFISSIDDTGFLSGTIVA